MKRLMLTLAAAGVLVSLSGCTTFVTTYDASGKETGSCKSVTLMSFSPGLCYGIANPDAKDLKAIPNK